MMSAKDSMSEYLESHPRMIGALFALMLLLSSSGVVAAGSGTTQVGP